MDTLSLEVTSKESVQGAKGEVERITKGRGLDVLVNNAFVSRSTFTNLPLRSWLTMIMALEQR